MMNLSPTPAGAAEIHCLRELLWTRKVAEARERCARLLLAHPVDPQVLLLAAEIALRTGDVRECQSHLQGCLATDSRDPHQALRVAELLFSSGQQHEAWVAAGRVRELAPEQPELCDRFGTLLTHLGEIREAVAYYERAVASAPKVVHFRYNLAMAQRMTGELAQAEANLDHYLSVQPYDGEAHHARSGLRRQTPTSNHVDELEARLSSCGAHRATVGLGYALAKELEDLKEYSRSFMHLSRAAHQHRAMLRYQVTDDLEVLDTLRRRHTQDNLRLMGSGVDADECVFIIGLPRSGTTLVERMVGSHSHVYAAGELDAFPNAVILAGRRASDRPLGKLELIEQSLKGDAASLARSYLSQVRSRIGNAARFTDKLPLNYLYAGLIHAALPRAKFVLVRRDPVDNCFAMYKTLFASGYPFSYDLSELGQYYLGWDKLMRHWQQLIGPGWLEIHYEDLVADPERVARQVTEHCGLSWEPACLDFHASRAPVATASATQVRQQIYTDSVGRWRHYEANLAPLAKYFEHLQ